MEKYTEVKELLKDYNQVDVEKFTSYCIGLEMAKNGSKNPFMKRLPANKLSDLFKRVTNEGLKFDGKHVTLQSTGINYDYMAYKNKMLMAYPESIIDVDLVYEGDEFTLAKSSGKVICNHEIVNPFDRIDSKIKGGYCIIKNKRGEFVVTLTKADFEKHRKVARTDFIWKAWYVEMCMKTLIKKCVRIMYDDVYDTIDEEDNKQINLNQIKKDWISDIDKAETSEELDMIWSAMSAKEQTNYQDPINEKQKSLK